MADPETDPDPLETARTLLRSGDKREAFRHLVVARTSATSDPKRLSMIAAAMEDADQFGSSLEVRNLIILALPDDKAERLAYLRVRASVFAADQGELWGILTQLDQLVAEAAFDSYELWLRAADLYLWLGAPAKRLWAARKALETDPGSIEVVRQVAYLYHHDGRNWRAWFLWRKLGKRRDISPPILLDLSQVSRRAGCTNLSIRFARMLQEAEPANLWSVLLLSQAMVAKGKVAKAASLLTARLDDILVFRDDPHFALQVAAILSQARAFEAERSVLRAASQIWPGHSEIMTALEVAEFASTVSSWAKPG